MVTRLGHYTKSGIEVSDGTLESHSQDADQSDLVHNRLGVLPISIQSVW